MENFKRLFLAIHILPDENLKSHIKNLSSELLQERIKWVEIDNLHITIKFFGETEIIKIPSIIQNVNQSIYGKKPFEFIISKTGIFGSKYNPKVIWLGIENSENFTNLSNLIINNLKNIGFESDRQNFVPHLTIGRINNVSNIPYFQNIINKYNLKCIQKININNIYLYESKLYKNGPVYEKIEKFSLN